MLYVALLFIAGLVCTVAYGWMLVDVVRTERRLRRSERWPTGPL